MVSPVFSIDSSIQTLSSALRSSSSGVTAAADNIANADTSGFTANRTLMTSTAPGVRAIVQPTGMPVDLTAQLVDLKTAAASYELAAKALGSIVHTEQQALNVIA
jgi:hypothetical protein